jgi:hypothetical protein
VGLGDADIHVVETSSLDEAADVVSDIKVLFLALLCLVSRSKEK